LHLSSAEISQITADFSDEREIQQKPQTGSFQEPEYPMKIIWSAITCVALFQISASAQPHEVWLFDQSDTHAGGGGGTLYIYDGAQLHGNNAAAATPEVIDLGGTAQSLALAQTGTVPVRPHMFFFNRSDLYSFSLASFTPVAAPPNTPAPYLVFSRDGFGVADSHGGVLTRGSRYLWVAASRSTPPKSRSESPRCRRGGGVWRWRIWSAKSRRCNRWCLTMWCTA
jgi:hypothetical protein